MIIGSRSVFIIIASTLLVMVQPVMAQERTVELDPRLGVVHVGSAYPDRHTIGDFMSWGANKVYRLGFNSTEIWMANNMCFGNNPPPTRRPHG